MCRVWCKYLIQLKVIAILGKVAPPLSNVLPSFCESESKIQGFLIIIDIHTPENFPALVWLQSAKKKIGLVHKCMCFEKNPI